MKKILSLGLAALMALTTASTVLADDGIMLISETEDAVAVAAAPNVAISNAAAQAAWLAMEDKDEVLALAAAFAAVPAGTAVKLYDEPVDNLVIDGVTAGDRETTPIHRLVRTSPDGVHPVTFRAPAMPRQADIDITVTGIDGVAAETKLLAAIGATRTFDIPQVEGFVSVVTVDGEELGAAKKLTFKNINNNIEVAVAYEKMMAVTPVYAEDFTGESTLWVSGGTAEAAVVAAGVLTEVSNGGDPNVNADLSSLALTTDKVDAVIVTYVNGTENTSAQLFYATEGNPNYSEAGSVKATVLPGANIAVFVPADGEGFTGSLNSMRLDLSNGEGTIAVDSIIFVDFDGIVIPEITVPAVEEAAAEEAFNLASVVR